MEKEMQITIFHRTNKGVAVSNEGELFLSYARQVLEQTSLLEEKFLHKKEQRSRFSVSCQHYSFAVDAFAAVIRQLKSRCAGVLPDVTEYDRNRRKTSFRYRF